MSVYFAKEESWVASPWSLGFPLNGDWDTKETSWEPPERAFQIDQAKLSDLLS